MTEENLANAYKIALKENLSTFLVVSDPLHMKRAILIAHDMGIAAYPSPTPTSRYRSAEHKLKFLMRESFFYLMYQARQLVS